MSRTSFGTIRVLPSKRYQVRYTAPDGKQRTAGGTFVTRRLAQQWLADEQSKIGRQGWRAPERMQQPLSEYADEWLKHRSLKPRTRADYRRILDQYVLPTLGSVALGDLTPEMVKRWWSDLGTKTGKVQRSHAYGLVRTILKTAVEDDILASNPVHIRGAGSVKPEHKVRPATPTELAIITNAMPERYRAMVVISVWCALRFGEMAALERRDVDLQVGVLYIRRGVVRAGGEVIVGTPKSDAGLRTVNIPPHLTDMMSDHLATHVPSRQDALLFPARNGGYLAPSTLYKVYYPARAKAGRDDLRWHDLRHTGAVLAADTGATIAELMARLGHSTPSAAMRYQHASADRDRVIAERMSAMAADASVAPLRVVREA